MSKRPPIDLLALTTEQAAPMSEATQRVVAPIKSDKGLNVVTAVKRARAGDAVAHGGEASLNFKVTPEFRKRFRRRAVGADLKLNELLVAALEAWEREQRL